MYKILLPILLIFFPACSKKQAEEKSMILTLKEMSDLATVEYTVTKIIKANDDRTWFKMGDRKILMSCEAYIKAGVDLGKINENNFQVSGKDVVLTLPPPKIVNFSIPPEKIKVEYEEVGVFRDPFSTRERDKLAAQAEVQIRNSVDSLGILDQAQANTSLLINNMLKQMGYENITIHYGAPIQVKKQQ